MILIPLIHAAVQTTASSSFNRSDEVTMINTRFAPNQKPMKKPDRTVELTDSVGLLFQKKRRTERRVRLARGRHSAGGIRSLSGVSFKCRQ
jgi:hypothetical protein